MNWYKKAQTLSGEWWIIDGQALFADADIGDMNHEAYVVDSIQRKYSYDKFAGEYVDWDGFKKELAREELTEQYGRKIAEKLLEKDPEKTEDAYLKKLREMGMTDEEYAIAEGIGDAREYGIKNLGWKRVKQNNVQTETLTVDDLRDIANGLWEAYDENCEKETFNIEVNSTSTIFEDVPYQLISNGAPTALQAYRRGY
jgi:hypothetical protein